MQMQSSWLFQNRDQEAEVKLDSLQQQYPDHGLDDDVLYLQSRTG